MPLGMVLFLSLQRNILPEAATAGNYQVSAGLDHRFFYYPVKKKVWSSGSPGGSEIPKKNGRKFLPFFFAASGSKTIQRLNSM